MTEEELCKAMMNAAPKPSLERRLGRLEADAAAQRTAILRLEKIARLLFKIVCALAVASMMLALLVLT
jgi:hypothetical protein